MSYGFNAAFAQDRLQQRRAQGEYVRTPSFTESFTVAMEDFRMAESLNARARNERLLWADQKAKLRKMRADGDLTEDEWQTHVKRRRRGGEMDWESLGRYVDARENTKEFDFSEQTLSNMMRAEYEERQKLMQNITGLSNIAMFGGTLTGFATGADALLMIVPGGQYKAGGTLAKTMGKVAFREALVGATQEAVLQANVYDFKRRMGVKHTLSEAALNILVGAVFDGTFSAGVVGGITYGKAVRASRARVGDLLESHKVLLKETQEKLPGADVPEVGPDFMGPGVRTFSQSVDDITKEVLEEAKASIGKAAEQKISKSERKRLEAELAEVTEQLDNLPEIDTPAKKKKGVSPRQARKEFRERQVAAQARSEERARLNARAEEIVERIRIGEVANRAESDLGRLDQGLIPERMQDEITRRIEQKINARVSSMDKLTAEAAAVDLHTKALIEDLETKIKFLESLPDNTRALDAERMYEQRFGTRLTDAEIESTAKANRQVQETFENNARVNVDEDLPAVDQRLADDARLEGSEQTFGEYKAEREQRLQDELASFDEAEACVRG